MVKKFGRCRSICSMVAEPTAEIESNTAGRTITRLSPWPKGVSGNPGGRAPDSVAKLVRLRVAATDAAGQVYAQQLIDRLIDIGLHSPREDSAIRAIETLFNRGFGLPRQSIEVTSDADDPRLAALQAIAATLRAQAGLSPLAPAADASAIDVPSAPVS